MVFILFCVCFVSVLVLFSKNDDNKKLINELSRKIDRLSSRLDYLSKKIDKPFEDSDFFAEQDDIVTEENAIEEENYEEEIYEKDNYEEKSYVSQIQYKSTNQNLEKNKNSLENFFLGNAFTIVGALALIIGIGIFIKLVSPFIVFTPLMKTIIGFSFGVGLIGISKHISNKDNLKMYSEVLMGTGFSALFITTLCATVLFKTFTPTVSAIIAGIVLVFSYIVADKQKTISMIAISLIGGYLNIFFASGINNELLWGYLIFLNILSVLYVYRNPKREWINIVNLVLSLLSATAFLLFKDKVNVVYPIILWLVYLCFDLFKIFNNKEVDKNNILNWVNFGVLTLFSLMIFGKEKLYIGITLICVALIYNILVAILIMKNSEKFKIYLYSMLVTILFSVYFLLDGSFRIAAWSLIAVIIAFAVKKLNREYLANWIIVFMAPAVTNLFFINGIVYGLGDYIPIFNDRLWVFSYPISSALISYLLTKNSSDKNVCKIAEILKFIIISLLYLYVSLEINNYLNQYSVLKGAMRILPLVIVGFMYSLQMKKISMANKLRLFEVLSYAVGLWSFLTLLIVGIHYYPIKSFIPIVNIRFLAYMTAIGSMVCYARWTRFDFYKYVAVILGFILLTCEAFDYTDKYASLNVDYIVSLVWLIYSGLVTTIGIIKNKVYLKNVGILTSVLTLVRVIFHDLSNVETIYKLIIFIALGTMFMLVSYLYNKNRK